jgi:hypothetical protein
MIANHRLPHHRPAFPGAIKPNRLVGAIVAAGLVATGLAAFESIQTHRSTAVHTEASDAFLPAINTGPSGAMLVYEPVW